MRDRREHVSDQDWPLLYVRGSNKTGDGGTVTWDVDDGVLHVTAESATSFESDKTHYRLVPVERSWVEVQR
jgi:hypothetical protein